jgi:hypothetical protein
MIVLLILLLCQKLCYSSTVTGSATGSEGVFSTAANSAPEWSAEGVQDLVIFLSPDQLSEGIRVTNVLSASSSLTECHCAIQLRDDVISLPIIPSVTQQTDAAPDLGCFLNPPALELLSKLYVSTFTPFVSMTCDLDGMPMGVRLPLTVFKLADLQGVMHARHQVVVSIKTDLSPGVIQSTEASFWLLRCALSSSEQMLPSAVEYQHNFTSSSLEMEAHGKGGYQQSTVNLTFIMHESMAQILSSSSAPSALCQLHAGGIATPVLFAVNGLPLAPGDGEEGWRLCRVWRKVLLFIWN